MRVIADVISDEILQVVSSPEVGEEKAINCKYVFELPDVTVPVNSSSYLYPVDGGDLYTSAFEALKIANGFTFKKFVALREGGDISKIDLAGSIASNPFVTPYTLITRLQTGSASDFAPDSTALLPINNTVTPAKPGCLITTTIDISGDVPAGTGTFMLYYKIYKFSVTEDINSEYGILAGTNEPAIKYIEEIDQEISGFSAAISVDDGLNYEFIPRMTTFVAVAPGTLLKLAFFNTGSEKIYLANYALFY